MEKVIEKEIVNAFCPYCLKDISCVWICKLESIIGVRYIYFCGGCQKRLGTFQKKVTNLGSIFHKSSSGSQKPDNSII